MSTWRPVRPGRRWRRALPVVISAALLLPACADEGLPQNTFDPEGPVARQLDDLVRPVGIIAALIFVVVEGLVLYVAIRYRRRSEEDAPSQVHGNAKWELGWTIAPALLLLPVALFTVMTVADINRKPKGPDVVPVEVIGHQFWWEFRYPKHGVVTANELHLPAGSPADITLTSEDVIHSFWPPKLAGKVDAIPNHRGNMVVEAERPGTYFGQCAEFCGLSHANMRLTVVAHTPEGFRRWVAANAEPAPRAGEGDAAAGARLFREKGCGSCHSVKGFAAGEVGPDLTHLHQRKVFAGAIFDLNRQNLRTWLRDPPAEKPGALMPNLNLSEDEITKLIAYLETLR